MKELMCFPINYRLIINGLKRGNPPPIALISPTNGITHQLCGHLAIQQRHVGSNKGFLITIKC